MLIGLEGRIFESDGWLAVEIPPLQIFTQGKDRADADFMARDAAYLLVDEDDEITLESLKVVWSGENTFKLFLPLTDHSIAVILKQLRTFKEVSLSETAEKLGLASKNSIAAYEKTGPNGRVPSITKFASLLETYGVDIELKQA